MKKTIGIGVPCYNEEVALPIFVDTISNYKEIIELKEKYNFIFIAIDDGSKDNTKSIMQKLAKERDDFFFLSFGKNYGKEAALCAIYDIAIAKNIDALIKMDVDLQDPPSLIPEFIKDWESSYLYVHGHMNGRKNQKFTKKFFSSSYYHIYRWISLEKGMKDGDRDYSIMDKSIIPLYASIKGPNRFDRSIAAHFHIVKKSVSYDFIDRVDGSTRWPFKKLLKYSISSFVQFGALQKFLTRISMELSFLIGFILLVLGIFYSNQPMYIVGSVLIGLFVILAIVYFLLNKYLEPHIRNKYATYSMYNIGETNIKEIETKTIEG